MKQKILLLVSAVSLAIASQAAVLTVSNNPSSPGQYPDVQSAITNSAVNDTIYIQPSPTDYSGFTINKRLTILGGGYDVNNTDYKLKTEINGYVYFDTTTLITDPVSGSKLAGLSFVYPISYASGDRGYIHNVTIERCYTSNYIYISGNNWLIKNCIINSSIDVGYYKNLVIANNFIVGTNINYTNQTSVYILNNIFLNNSSYDLYSSSFANVYNNIFYNNTSGTGTNCIYNNNITYASTPVTLPTANNTGSGNLNQKDPKFVSTNIPAPGTTINWYDLKKYDWHLQAGSPGYLAGTDGLDIGVYGGPYPWVNFTGQTALPLVQVFNIKNPVVKKDGSINVVIKAKTQK